MQRKILYIIDCGLLDGGAPRSTGILADEMAKNNDVYMLMPYTGEEGNPYIHYIQLPHFHNRFPFLFKQPLSALRLVYDIYKVIRNINPNIIHAEMPRGARAVGLLKKMGLIKVPIVFTEREYVTGLRSVYKWLYRFLIIPTYDLIVCLSNKSRPFWEKYRKYPVVTIPNPGGKEFDVYREDEYNEAISCLTGYQSDRLNVLFVGRYLNTKRWELAESIIYNYCNKYPNGRVHFYVAVAYDLNDEKALSMVNRLSELSKVTLFSNVDVNMMSNLYYACDLHLITSKIESFGRTAIEAMSRKCAVYSTDAGAISETIGDKELILPAEAEAFIEIISKFEKDKDLLETKKEAMYHRYQSLYTTEANYMANKNEYDKLLS